jgi:hypothetical protein
MGGRGSAHRTRDRSPVRGGLEDGDNHRRVVVVVRCRERRMSRCCCRPAQIYYLTVQSAFAAEPTYGDILGTPEDW